jgi:hypothetical protein
MDKVAPAQVYLWALRFSPANFIPPMLHSLMYTYHPELVQWAHLHVTVPRQQEWKLCSRSTNWLKSLLVRIVFGAHKSRITRMYTLTGDRARTSRDRYCRQSRGWPDTRQISIAARISDCNMKKIRHGKCLKLGCDQTFYISSFSRALKQSKQQKEINFTLQHNIQNWPRKSVVYIQGSIPVHSKRAMRYRVRPWDGERHSRAGLHAHSGAHDELSTCTLQTSELILRLFDTL